jgi:enediyne biosynthesis protein E4
MMNNMTRLEVCFIGIFAFALTACSGGNGEPVTSDDSTSYEMGFTTLTTAETGIDFTNRITETDSFNFFNYEYIYNGGGVATGDINNDGLADIYFTGNQVPDKLYLNKGDMKFEDITAQAIGPKSSEGWRTGVVMVDINNDGWLDLYVSRSGKPTDKNLLANLLFVNNGDLTFTEKGAEYGVDVRRPTTQSAFFDYDNDGDLDLYVMNLPYNQSNTNEQSKSVQEVEAIARKGSEFSDVLLKNENGSYVDVSKEAGITNHAFGLGLAISDIDRDGYKDIYVSNDYMAPDYMYMNNGDGTFSEQIKSRTGHISSFSMGNDITDFNNDGWPDILTVDMVSEDHIRSKKNMGGMSTKKFWDVVNVGYHYQYMFNALQLNNGNGTFSDIAQLAGIAKTDWSWAPLFADFDNDGFNDLFITNGYRRDSRDNDYNLKMQERQGKVSGFQEALELMPATKIENYIFRNNGDLTFAKKTEEWRINQPVNSNGAAYSDLDNDGDLDLVLNNMDEVSFVLRNDLQSQDHFIKLKITGPEKNRMAVGATVTIRCGGTSYYRELFVERGYQSSVDPVLHFGLGKVAEIDELTVNFMDGKGIRVNKVKTDQLLELNYSDAVAMNFTVELSSTLFEELTDEPLKHVHQERFVNDFQNEILLPHKMSQLGPFMSKGDVNGDQLEDIYISGSRGFAGSLYLQSADGNFTPKAGPWAAEKEKEELGSVMFDADGDKDLDLYITSGSNEYTYDSKEMKDRLFINDGAGNFVNETAKRLPEMMTSGQRVAVGDYDQDGDADLFVGGRQTPGFYPFAPRSYLLRNNNGVFEEVTPQSPDLMGPGMITESLFDDFDGDGDPDLICVGEWMPVSFFENSGGVFKNVTKKYGLGQSVGWWMSISAADFNGDGKNDYVLGNVGENNKFHPSADKPLEIYCHDFDASGSYDIVLGKYQDGICYPVRGRQCSSEQMPFIQQKFPTYSEFAVANLEKIYGKENLDKALHYSAHEFASCVLLSNGTGFNLKHLPVLSQFGPLNKTLTGDFNNDGHVDILGAGNNFGAEVETIRYDGGRGVLLIGDGNGNFNPFSPLESGFLVTSDAKDMVMIGNLVFVSSNHAPVKAFKIRKI